MMLRHARKSILRSMYWDWSKIAVIHDKGDYGKGLAEFARLFLEKSGRAEVTLFEGVTRAL